MRTTIDIEDDILMAAKEIARQRRISIGKVISDLARKAMTQNSRFANRGDVPLFPVKSDGGIVSLEMVNRLRDET